MAVVEINKKELRKAQRRAKRRAVKEKLKAKGRAALDWIDIHREETIAIGAGVTALGGFVTKIVKGHNKKKQLEEERELKENFVWDRRQGHYWRVKRKLSNQEWLEIDRRYREGQSMGNILSDLRLL